jgi:hypothetical protein
MREVFKTSGGELRYTTVVRVLLETFTPNQNRAAGFY